MVKSDCPVRQILKVVNGVDKQKQGISIKINGQERTYSLKEVENEKEEDTELDTYENHEVAAAKEAEDDDFTWVLPTTTENEKGNQPFVAIEDVRNVGKKSNKSKGFGAKSFRPRSILPSKTFLFAVLLGVLIGTGFGMIILNLLTNELVEEQVASNQPQGNTSDQNSVGEKENDPSSKGEKEAVEGKTVSLNVAPLTPVVVQAGIFSTNDSGQLIVDKIKGLGYSAVMLENADTYIVLAGVGSNVGLVKQMSSVYVNSNQEHFVKPFTINGGDYQNVPENESQYFGKAVPIYNEIASVSSGILAGSDITVEQWQKVVGLFNQVDSLNPEQASEHMQSFSTNLTNAYNIVNSYFETKDKATLWQSQQALLDGLKSYQQWVNNLS
jgi:stage II sporulation protein B